MSGVFFCPHAAHSLLTPLLMRVKPLQRRDAGRKSRAFAAVPELRCALFEMNLGAAGDFFP
jgi:hypothetical protein